MLTGSGPVMREKVTSEMEPKPRSFFKSPGRWLAECESHEARAPEGHSEASLEGRALTLPLSVHIACAEGAEGGAQSVWAFQTPPVNCSRFKGNSLPDLPDDSFPPGGACLKRRHEAQVDPACKYLWVDGDGWFPVGHVGDLCQGD